MIEAVAAAEDTQRRRDEIMSKITANARGITYLSPQLGRGISSEQRTVVQRSLEGLVTFLICYFHHLPVSEALHFLAKAGLLATVHLIEYGWGMGPDCSQSPLQDSNHADSPQMRGHASFTPRSGHICSQIAVIGFTSRAGLADSDHWTSPVYWFPHAAS